MKGCKYEYFSKLCELNWAASGMFNMRLLRLLRRIMDRFIQCALKENDRKNNNEASA